MHTNDEQPLHGHGHTLAGGEVDSEHPGYEVTDVHVGGIVVFLAGLIGFVLVFFVFCFGMGKVINRAIERQDGPANKWNAQPAPPTVSGGKVAPVGREDLASNATMEQRDSAQVVNQFNIGPRLDADDGNQGTADLHAREDLLLNHYSSIDGGGVRIPIDRAMQLIAQRGLPVSAAAKTEGAKLTGVKAVEVHAPLTNGFARTGYELDTIETREQKLKMAKPEGEAEKK